MAWSGWFHTLVLSILPLMFCTADMQRCGGESSIYGHMLRNHIFQKIKTSDAYECLQACDANVRCQSFNYVMLHDQCELNNRTKEARPMDFVWNEERYYMKRSYQRVPLGSIAEMPAESCNEIKASEGGEAVSGMHWLDSIVPGTAVLAYCDMETLATGMECLDYLSLTSAERKETGGILANPAACDKSLGPGWFRFQGAAGKRMPTSCTLAYRCGTHSTGWLNGAHPTVVEGRATRQVCFSWGSNCCTWFIDIQVRNCGSYFVYYFSGTPPSHPCNLGYCGTE